MRNSFFPRRWLDNSNILNLGSQTSKNGDSVEAYKSQFSYATNIFAIHHLD